MGFNENIDYLRNQTGKISKRYSQLQEKFSREEGYTEDDGFGEWNTFDPAHNRALVAFEKHLWEEFYKEAQNFPIGLINGEPANASQINDFFKKHAVWDDLDYREDRDSRPEEGDPMMGYRVFIYTEENDNLLGSPVTGGPGKSERTGPFQIPQYKDSVNIDDTGHGFYIFKSQGAALRYAQVLLGQDDHDPDISIESPVHISVFRVEGTYIDKYKDDPDPDTYHADYGELINDMKVVGDAVLDIATTGQDLVETNHDNFMERFESITKKVFYERNPLLDYGHYASSWEGVQIGMKNSFWKSVPLPQSARTLTDMWNDHERKKYTPQQRVQNIRNFLQDWRQELQKHPKLKRDLLHDIDQFIYRLIDRRDPEYSDILAELEEYSWRWSY